jgi:hypothetical protein
MKKRASWALFLSGLLLGAGYSKGLVVAEGRVTLDGEPVAGAAVMCHPLAEGTAPAHGETDADGRFALFTTSAEGAGPGRYKVTVTKTEGTAVVKGPSRVMGTDGRKKSLPGKKKPGDLRHVLPLVYKELDSTPLEIDVPAGGSHDLQIALKRQ